LGGGAVDDPLDGTKWTAFPAPMINGDNNSFLQGVVDISPTLAWTAGNVSDGAHRGQVIEQWDGTKWSLFPGPKFRKKDQADVFAMTASSANDGLGDRQPCESRKWEDFGPFRTLERHGMDGDHCAIEQ
jgi:hypothetical protein